MKPPDSGGKAVNLEDAFFAEEHGRLLERLRAEAERERQRELLRKVVQIDDRAFLDRLLALDITPERALAMRLLPLVRVAWADGNVDERERQAVLDAARTHGVAPDEATLALLRTWLERRPPEKLFELWKEHVAALWSRFTANEQWQMRQNLLGSAHQVAQAAGGFLGLAKVSAGEQAVLDELARCLEA